MNHRQNPLFWSFGAGTWAGVSLRISWFMPLLLGALLYQFGMKLGGSLFGIIFVSVLLHEISHILAARATDGSGDEILMWPLGGLAFVEGSSPRTQALIAAAGPMANLLLCGLFLPAVYGSNSYGHVFNPLEVPFSQESFGLSIVSDVQVLTFWFNWVSLLVNLVPAYPLDGGQVFRSLLAARLGTGMGTEVALRCGIAVAVVLAIVAFVFSKVLLLGLAFLIILLAVQENHQIQANESYDDSFMGYDFSQGYTSLERTEAAKPERRTGLLARWLAARRAERQRRQQEQAVETEQQLDAILAKVHERGLVSLTPWEKRLLKRASNRFRSRDSGPE